MKAALSQHGKQAGFRFHGCGLVGLRIASLEGHCTGELGECQAADPQLGFAARTSAWRSTCSFIEK